MEAQARKRSRQEARATEAETAAAAPAAYQDRQYCPDCRRVTEALVVDYGRADVMCTECERILVGPFLAIDIPRDAVGAASTPKNKKRRRRGKASASTDEGFDAAISGMADRLGLTAAVGDRAKEVYKKMEEANAWPRCQGWNTDRSRGPLYAACVAVACRNEGSPRTLKELASAVADGAAPATRCDIGRLTKHIRKRLGEEEAGQATGIGMVRVSSYLRRFCPLLGMGDPEASAAWMAARRLDEDDLEVRHTAESVAAGVVCLALERAGANDPVVKDVSAATGVSTTTIYAVRQKLLPRADLLFG